MTTQVEKDGILALLTQAETLVNALVVSDVPPPPDVTAPDTMIVTGPPNSTATTATIAFTGTDNVAVVSFEGSLDGAAFAPATSPVNLSGLSVGAHAYSVRAKDAAGNVDPTPAVASWTVSAILPPPSGAFKSMTRLSVDSDPAFQPKTGPQRVEVILGGSGTWATLAPTQASLGNGFGERWSAICDTTMGLADNAQFRVNVQDGTPYQSDGVTTLHVQPVDVVWGNPTWQQTFETYYFGHTAEETPKVLHPYTERRLDAALAWVEQNYPGSSTTKRTISGGSMGAWGAMSYAIRRANKFAAIFASRPRLRYSNSGVGHVSVPDYKWAALDQPNVLIEGTTETAGQHLDMVAYAANPANTMPFIAMCVGRLDGYMWFPDYVDFVAACRATNRGFVFAWNNGDHGGGDIMASTIATPLGSYNRGLFEVGIGYPVLSGSSLDQNPAVDLVGGINLGFSWRNIVESANGWSCEITNLNANCTVNVMPHSSIYTATVAAKPVTIIKGAYTAVSFP